MRLAALYDAVQACGLPRNVQAESESYQSSSQHSPHHALEVREALKDGARQWSSQPATFCQKCYTACACKGQIALQKYLQGGDVWVRTWETKYIKHTGCVWKSPWWQQAPAKAWGWDLPESGLSAARTKVADTYVPRRLLILDSGKSHAKGPAFLLPAAWDFLGCAEGNVFLLETSNDHARQSQTLSAGDTHAVCPEGCFSP